VPSPLGEASENLLVPLAGCISDFLMTQRKWQVL